MDVLRERGMAILRERGHGYIEGKGDRDLLRERGTWLY